jgi:hypothetical protein
MSMSGNSRSIVIFLIAGAVWLANSGVAAAQSGYKNPVENIAKARQASAPAYSTVRNDLRRFITNRAQHDTRPGFKVALVQMWHPSGSSHGQTLHSCASVWAVNPNASPGPPLPINLLLQRLWQKSYDVFARYQGSHLVIWARKARGSSPCNTALAPG